MATPRSLEMKYSLRLDIRQPQALIKQHERERSNFRSRPVKPTRNPLSDQIWEILSDQGVPIARRTVSSTKGRAETPAEQPSKAVWILVLAPTFC